MLCFSFFFFFFAFFVFCLFFMFAVFFFSSFYFFFICFLGFSLNFIFLHFFCNFSFLHVSCLFSFFFNFQCVTVSCLMFLFSFNFSCSSHESFSSFLVSLSRAGGFGPSFSAWRLAPSSLGRCWQFSERELPLPFPVWGWAFLSGWPSLPWVGVGLLSRVKVGQAPRGKASQKGEKGKARGPANRKGRGGARPDPEGEGQA